MSEADQPPAEKAQDEPDAPPEPAPPTSAPAADVATAAPVAADGDGDGDGDGGGKIKKRKVSMFLAYVGKGYQGMQRNPGAVTIEDELERAIVAAGGILPDNAGDFTKVQWMRAARTDKGVSAVGQSISLRMMLEHPTDKRDVITRINEKLPEGFEFFGYTRVTGGFNAKTMCDRTTLRIRHPHQSLRPAPVPPARGDRGGGDTRG